MNRPVIELSREQIDAAEALVPANQVRRTRVSPVDTLGGILGEFAFAQWLTGDWRNNSENVDLPFQGDAQPRHS
jgi:hypothetical protein